MNYNPHDRFPLRPASERDGEYEWRAVIFYNWGAGHNEVMFPPIQLRSTENKYEFNRELTAYKQQLTYHGNRIVSVSVMQGGKEAYRT